MKRSLITAVAVVAIMFFAAGVQAHSVNDTQRMIRQAGAQWTAGPTSMSGLSHAQLAQLCNLDLTVPEGYEPVFEPEDSTKADLPARLDWRDIDGKDFSTPIKQQHPCGTCATFSTLGAFEALFKITMDNPFVVPDFSEQQVYSCAGVLPYTLFHPNRTLKDMGVADEACMPYDCPATGSRPPCEDRCADFDNRAIHSTDWKVHMFPSNEKLKQLLQNGPIVVGFQVTIGFQDYTGGVYEPVSKIPIGGHGVAIFGYDDEGGYWICKNSWGEEWGEKGWFRYKYDTGMLKFGYQAASITVDADTLCGLNSAPVLSALALPNAGSDLNPNDALEVTFSFQDTEANLAGGELFTSIDGAASVRYATPLTELTGTSSAGKEAVVFSVPGPYDPGEHSLAVYVADLCGAASNELSGTFSVAGDADDDDATDDDATDDDDADDPDDDDDDDAGCGCRI